MRQISNSSIWWHKRALPCFWFGFIAVFSCLVIAGAVMGKAPYLMLIAPCIIAIFGYQLMKHLVFPLADEVWLDDEDMIVRKGGVEDRFPISQIINVESLSMQSPEHIRLTLRSPCELGSDIVFSPTARLWQFNRHPIADKLLRRIHGTSGTEPDG